MQSNWRKLQEARARRKLANALEPICKQLGLEHVGTSVYNPQTKRWRTYKSVQTLLHDCQQGEFGQAFYDVYVTLAGKDQNTTELGS